jgi:hypothetical protein
VPRTWQAVLQAAGYPTTVITLDLETYFSTPDKYSLKDLTVTEYIAHPKFEILGMASKHVGLTEGDAEWHEGFADTHDYLHRLQTVYGDDLAGVTISMHNSSFDAQILAMVFRLYPKYLIDTVGLSRQINSRRKVGLKDLCEEYHLPAKGDTASFEGLSLKARTIPAKIMRKKVQPPKRVPPMSPEQRAAISSYALNDATLQWQLCKILLPKICRSEIELRICQHTTELATRPVLMLDYARAESILQRMEAEADAAVQKVMVCYDAP